MAQHPDSHRTDSSIALQDADFALLQRIIDDAKGNRLRLPSLPDLAQRVRVVVNDPRRSAAEVARVVQFDPALAARLIQIANSPLYRGSKRFDNCHSAITRIGLVAARNLLLSLGMRNLFAAQTPLLRERLQRTWQHSCRVAAISSVLARLTPGLDADRALLAGLVHDIGVLPLLQYIDSLRIAMEPQRLEGLMERARGVLGVFVLRAWQFDVELANIPAQVEDWERDSGPSIDYGDVVQVAHVHSLFGRGGYSGPPLPELKAYRKFTISRLGPDCSLELLERSQQDIAEVLHILQG